MLPASEESALPAESEFNAVLDTYSGMIWRICGSYEADAEKRRDLHQEALVAIWRALPKFRGDAKAKTPATNAKATSASVVVARGHRRLIVGLGGTDVGNTEFGGRGSNPEDS